MITCDDEFGASCALPQSTAFLTTVNSSIQCFHVVDSEVENTSFWSLDPESFLIFVVDAVAPVHDNISAVAVWRCKSPYSAMIQHGMTLECSRLTFENVLLFICDTVKLITVLHCNNFMHFYCKC